MESTPRYDYRSSLMERRNDSVTWLMCNENCCHFSPEWSQKALCLAGKSGKSGEKANTVGRTKAMYQQVINNSNTFSFHSFSYEASFEHRELRACLFTFHFVCNFSCLCLSFGRRERENVLGTKARISFANFMSDFSLHAALDVERPLALQNECLRWLMRVINKILVQWCCVCLPFGVMN